MRIGLTGACGNIGQSTMLALSKENVQVSCFDIPSDINKGIAARYSTFNWHWGDIRQIADVKPMLDEVDVLVHLAAIIPPTSETKPDFARSINVDAVLTMVDYLEQCAQKKRIIFTSSIAVHGLLDDKELILNAESPYNTFDHYSEHKKACEDKIRGSSIDWTILRLCAVPPSLEAVSNGIDDLMLMASIGAEDKIEFCHSLDVGQALCNAALHTGINKKIMFIGGGDTCRVDGCEFIAAMLTAAGIGGIARDKLNREPSFYGGWVDSEESQSLLNYQKHTFADYCAESRKALGMLPYLTKSIAPFIRWYIVRRLAKARAATT